MRDRTGSLYLCLVPRSRVVSSMYALPSMVLVQRYATLALLLFYSYPLCIDDARDP